MKGFLKTAQTDPLSLRKRLHRSLSGDRPGRSLASVRASDVVHEDREFCPRLYALRDAAKLKVPPERLSTALAVTFDYGNMIQNLIIDWLVDIAITDWGCQACNRLHELQRRPLKCLGCGNRGFTAIEHRVTSAVSGVSCGIDSFLLEPDGSWSILECKSIDKEEFKKLAGPLSEHKVRTSYYQKIVSESADPRLKKVKTDAAKILYLSKGGYGVAAPDVPLWNPGDAAFSPFKEYTIQRDDSLTEDKDAKVLAVKAYREGAPMPAGVCPTSFCARAKKCFAVKECFGGVYPPGQKSVHAK